jgi:hypothetical protein
MKPAEKKMKWREIRPKKIRTFQLEDEPEIFYVIPLRFGENMIVYEDAHDLTTGKVEFLSDKEIEDRFGVSLDGKI